MAEGKILRIFFRYYLILRNAEREADRQLSKFGGKKVFPSHRNSQYLRYFSIFAEAISLLLGNKKDPAARKNMVYLSILAPVFDDLTDVQHCSPHELELWLQQKSKMGGISQAEVCTRLYSHLLQAMPQQQLFQNFLGMLKDAQKNPDLNPLELPMEKDNKGGLTAILCRLLWENEFLKGEKEAFLHLGFLVQLMDDFLDYYDDGLNNQPNHWKGNFTLKTIDEIFTRHYTAWIQRVMQLSYPHKNKQDFLWFLLPALSVFWVQMKQFQQNPLFKDGFLPENLFSIPRRHFICDMEKIRNQIRLLQVSSGKSISLKGY